MQPMKTMQRVSALVLASTLLQPAFAETNSKKPVETTAASAQLVDYVSGTFEVDPAQSQVRALAPPARGEGRFKQMRGSLYLARPFSESKATVVLAVNSLDTGDSQRDQQLQGASVLNAAQFPEITITSKSFEGVPNAFKMKADVKIKDVSKEVVFQGAIKSTQRGVGGQATHRLEMSGTFKRQDFKLQFDDPHGGKIGDQIILKLQLAEAMKDNRDAPGAPPSK